MQVRAHDLVLVNTGRMTVWPDVHGYITDQPGIGLDAALPIFAEIRDRLKLPVLTDVEGIVKYEDLIPGVTVREVSDEKTGVSSKVVTDSRGTSSKNTPELRPSITVKCGLTPASIGAARNSVPSPTWPGATACRSSCPSR